MSQHSSADFDTADFAYRNPRNNLGNEHQIAIRSPQGDGPDGYDWRIVNADRKTTRGFVNSASLAVSGWVPLTASDPAVDKPQQAPSQLDRIEALLGKVAENTEPKRIRIGVRVSPREIADRSCIAFN